MQELKNISHFENLSNEDARKIKGGKVLPPDDGLTAYDSSSQTNYHSGSMQYDTKTDTHSDYKSDK